MYQMTTVDNNNVGGGVLYFNDYNEAYIKNVPNRDCMRSLFYARKSLCQSFMCTGGMGFGFEAISFESVLNPGWYLRHSSFQVVLNKNDNTELFKLDASFFQVQSEESMLSNTLAM